MVYTKEDLDKLFERCRKKAEYQKTYRARKKQQALQTRIERTVAWEKARIEIELDVAAEKWLEFLS